MMGRTAATPAPEAEPRQRGEGAHMCALTCELSQAMLRCFLQTGCQLNEPPVPVLLGA